jgi:hypothetical protein
MIKAMVESSQNPERLEGARLLVQLGRYQQAIPILREIAPGPSTGERARAEALLNEATQADADRP